MLPVPSWNNNRLSPSPKATIATEESLNIPWGKDAFDVELDAVEAVLDKVSNDSSFLRKMIRT